MPREYSLEKTRNIGLIAHIDAGKTTVTERILYYTGKKHKIGKVHEGEAEMDWMEQEKERGITITSAATTCQWEKHQINIIDTPGHIDFTAEVQRSLRILDGAVVVFDGKMGVEPQSETVWRQADEYDIPRICFINKINLVGGNFYKSIESIHERLSPDAFPIFLPIGQGKELHGIIDLIKEQAWLYADEEGTSFKKGEIPEDLKDKVAKYRQKLLEKAAEMDDKLMEKYLEEKEIKIAEIKKAIRAGVVQGKFFPVLGGDGRKAVVKFLLNCVNDYLPHPLDVDSPVEVGDNKPLAALAFKVANDPYVGQLTYIRMYSGTLKTGQTLLNSTQDKKVRIGRMVRMHADHREEIEEVYAGNIAAIVGGTVATGDTLCQPENPVTLETIRFPEPVVSVSIQPKSKSDQEKLGEALRRLTQEDPTFQVKANQDTGETIISGMGELHLEIILDRLFREFKIEAQRGKPRVAYKETIKKEAEAQGLYIKQSGGRGQYGDVYLRLEPWTKEEKEQEEEEEGELENDRYKFINEIRGGTIPQEFIPAVEKGVKEAMDKGVVAGYPLTNIKVTVYDGSFHDVDSSEAAFKVAGSKAFQKAAKSAKPVLLEPVMSLEALAPESFLGDVVGDLGSRRANVEKIIDKNNLKSIEAKVPLATMFGYVTQLRSLTQGRATFTMEFFEYQEVPQSVAEEIIGVEEGS